MSESLKVGDGTMNTLLQSHETVCHYYNVYVLSLKYIVMYVVCCHIIEFDCSCSYRIMTSLLLKLGSHCRVLNYLKISLNQFKIARETTDI